MKTLIATLVMLTSFNALADVDLKFKSEALNKLVAVFAKHAPELVKNGTVEVAYCGTYGAAAVLDKLTSEQVKEQYVLSPEGILDAPDFTALELTEKAEQEMRRDIQIVTGTYPHNLRVNRALAISRYKDGVVYASGLSASIVTDFQTSEYLMISGTMWQDDCD